MNTTPICLKNIFFYITSISPKNEDASRLLTFFRWLFSASFASIVGIFSVAVFLSAISKFSPALYRTLTKWANQPPVPIVKNCTFVPLQELNESQSEASKFLHWYDVNFTLDTSVGEEALAVAYTDDLHFAIYNHGHRAKPKSTDPAQIFIPKVHFTESFKLTVVHDSDDGKVTKFAYEGRDCPVKVEFFGGTR